MRWITLSLCCFLWHGMALASDFTGVYSFSKGVNKASGTLYIYQWSTDSAFILLQAVSGMPDFFTAERKGFIRIENNTGLYPGNDSCSAQLLFGPGTCQWNETGKCTTEFNASSRYKRINTRLKKSASYMPGVDVRNGTVNRDSVSCYAAPHPFSEKTNWLTKSQDVQIADEYNGFYLVELPYRLHEFFWVPKKLITVIR